MQATYGTLAGYMGVSERTAVRASCPLAGGGANGGSTCGVVSGGCMAIVLAHLADVLSGEAGKGEALYERLREYTGWFEEKYGSTLCRERCGADIKEINGILNYLFTGKVVTRCVNHIGAAASHLLGLMNCPLDGGGEVTGIDERLASSGGFCAAEVIKGVRDDMGSGSLFLEQLSLAFDGGIGLSGGLCGALAGALMSIGLIWGIDPKKEGLVGTLIPTLKGNAGLFRGRREPGLWSIAYPFAREFARKYGSLECVDIVGRSFGSGTELAEFMSGSSLCAEIKDWCRERTSELIDANTVFSA